MKFSLLVNMKMPTIVGILRFISRYNFVLMFSKKELAIVSNLDLLAGQSLYEGPAKSFVTGFG